MPDGWPEALIFDVDGTLAETEELHRRAFNAAFADAGLRWNWSQDDYRALLTTTGGKERIARYVTERGGDPATVPVAELHKAKTAHYVDLMARGQIALRPGIADLIDEARAAGRRLAIATTTSPANVEALCLAVFGKPAAQVFDVIAAGDEVPAKKPAPDIYLLALQRLGLTADRAVALEDSRNGLRSARAAKLACVVSPGVYTAGEDFSAATLVLGCFTDLGGLAGLSAVRT
ncbi:HAD family hydrolase [Rhodobacter ferrooxidans]|uniref:HAD-superfamily hydrolase, subfamily IA, variant 3 n=1 Tax=Rhodobacter ferrooxidans TaxID=371731 RepID=C8RX29_9RHOB|nr:HAD family hydrolase [Rhodobacter sp. SW2]EEW26554.1 HAD-superfamily hydrolase, subfamily IA, variant 3 [Rhodobacter sp. SW2]